MNRLLLVDGHNLLFRMFYGMPDNFYTPLGRKYNAVYGFASAMKKVISLIRPTHAIVVFDSPDCGDRRKLDEAYKANRPDFSDAAPEDCPFTQLPAIYAMLDEMQIPHREIHGCEADDVIASYAMTCAGDFHVVIFSTDRDYWQLISENVSILDYHGMDSTLITPPTVEKKFGVKPEQFADFKCLIGDPSDNIAGVPGVGPKRAAELLGRYGTLENLLLHTDEIERPSVRKALEESRERLELNNRLIRLCPHAELPLEPAYLAFRARIPSNPMTLAMELADEYYEENKRGGEEHEKIFI
ncbi:MAG: flap endonuclease [Clostridia bacterium]|nr:flap endonuclease [Clostridia bacterium]